MASKLKHNPSVVILGARQIGKTTIAKPLGFIITRDSEPYLIRGIKVIGLVKFLRDELPKLMT